jgi:signal transduction histidine kinase
VSAVRPQQRSVRSFGIALLGAGVVAVLLAATAVSGPVLGPYPATSIRWVTGLARTAEGGIDVPYRPAPQRREGYRARVRWVWTDPATWRDITWLAAELRRIERDLHDGAQARLAALTITMAAARELLADGPRRGRPALRPGAGQRAHRAGRVARPGRRHPPAGPGRAAWPVFAGGSASSTAL